MKILAIDGGGVRGLIAARVLAELEQRLKARAEARGVPAQPLALNFDIVAGTSTGAIMAAGLTVGGQAKPGVPLATAEELVAFYRHQSPKIFRRPVWRRGWWMLSAKFRVGPLVEFLDAKCGNARLSQALRPLILPAYDPDRREVRVFRAGPGLAGLDADYRVRDVLRACTAAPGLFTPARIAPIGSTRPEELIDGAVCVNNPTLLAVFEARRLARDHQPLHILSIGTGSDRTSYPYHQIRRWGYIHWLNPRRGVPLLSLLLSGQAELTDRIVYGIQPHPHRYVRLSPPLLPDCASLDDASPRNLDRLEETAESLIADRSDDLDRVVSWLS